jgi:integrase/recombinase XerD
MEHFFDQHSTIARLRGNVLGLYIDAFADWLHDNGYGRWSGRHRIQLAAMFGDWLEQNHIAVADVCELHIRQCASSPRLRHRIDVIASLKLFLKLLQRMGVIAIAVALSSELAGVQQLIDEYGRYLLNERVFTAKSASHYTRHVRRFLSDRFPDGNVDLSVISAAEVVGFVQRQAACLKQTQAKLMTLSLRSFLRYAALQGYVASRLENSVPIVPKWSVVSIPRALSRKQVDRVLRCCDRQSIKGRRDYAILLLLARLGLRGGAIVSLRLEDINWHAGIITIRSKGVEQQLPLHPDVGEAIAAYLKDGRPQVASRSLFISLHAPWRGLADSSSISNIVEQALARAGVNAPSKGAHQFRHTLATSMLRAGASLAEIGSVLGHRSPTTTMIYAKVDVASLQKLALPWPGGAA